jgi:hypothetical protein
MELRYQLTMADYGEAQYYYQKRSAATYILFAGGIFLTTLSASRAARMGIWEAFWQLLVGVFLLLLPIMQYLFTLRRIQISASFGEPITAVPGPDGLCSTSEIGQITLKWSAFIRVQETRRQFILRTSYGSFYLIPKRAFSALELEEFRNLLMHHIPRK